MANACTFNIYFGLYISALGLAGLFFPTDTITMLNLYLTMPLGLTAFTHHSSANNEYFMLAFFLVFYLGFIYTVAGLMQNRGFFTISIISRVTLVCCGFPYLIRRGMLSNAYLIFVAQDGVTSIITAILLMTDSKQELQKAKRA